MQGGEEVSENWSGENRPKIFGLQYGPRSKVVCHQVCGISRFSLLPAQHEFGQRQYERLQQSGISLNLRTGPTGHATVFNQ